MMKGNLLVCVAALILIFQTFECAAQKDGTYNVGILLYDGVELLDFAGPGEVFAATSGFNVFTVSLDGSSVLSQRFVTIMPRYSINNAPMPDILVLPGGGTRKIAENETVLAWIRTINDSGGINLSVCTGANILANAGLLEGLSVTTWYGFIDRLQDFLPNSKVLKDTRFVDNGNIITTAGVSAGIDGSLHLVSRLKGQDVANGTARYMEYDKWVPEDGKSFYTNDFLEAFILKATQNPNEIDPIDLKKPPFYEGEGKNVAASLFAEGRIVESIELLESVVKYYPNSVSAFGMLSSYYEKNGQYAPPTEENFIEMIIEGGIDEAEQLYDEVQNRYPGWKLFSEQNMNSAGYEYLSTDVESAIKIFELNCKEYPLSANTFDSLGEAYKKRGDKEKALHSYKKALKLNPKMASSANAIKELNKK